MPHTPHVDIRCTWSTSSYSFGCHSSSIVNLATSFGDLEAFLEPEFHETSIRGNWDLNAQTRWGRNKWPKENCVALAKAIFDKRDEVQEYLIGQIVGHMYNTTQVLLSVPVNRRGYMHGSTKFNLQFTTLTLINAVRKHAPKYGIMWGGPVVWNPVHQTSPGFSMCQSFIWVLPRGLEHARAPVGNVGMKKYFPHKTTAELARSASRNYDLTEKTNEHEVITDHNFMVNIDQMQP